MFTCNSCTPWYNCLAYAYWWFIYATPTILVAKHSDFRSLLCFSPNGWYIYHQLCWSGFLYFLCTIRWHILVLHSSNIWLDLPIESPINITKSTMALTWTKLHHLHKLMRCTIRCVAVSPRLSHTGSDNSDSDEQVRPNKYSCLFLVTCLQKTGG